MKNLLIVSLLFSVLLASVFSSKAQLSNYTFTATSGTYTALSSSTAPALSGGTTDEGWYNSIPIGFDFYYLNNRYNSIGASTNGWLTLGLYGTNISNARSSNGFTITTMTFPYLAPLWDDLDFTQSLGLFSYKTTGTAPNRVFTAEWLNAEWGSVANDSVISFQVKLYESTGVISFVYRQENSPVVSGSASIGISGMSSSSYLSLDGTGSAPVSSSTVSTNNLSTKPASGQVYSFSPPAVLAPSGLVFSSIKAGSMKLQWTDNATNETGYLIYISTDSINFNLYEQTGSNKIMDSIKYLVSGTKYYVQIFAVAQGRLSSPLIGSQTTAAGTMSGVYTIPGNFSTLTSALYALDTNGFAGNVIFELQNSYLSLTETFPITFTKDLGTAPNKTLTIRPASGVNNVSITRNLPNLSVISFDNCKYVTIDGRPGGTGSSEAIIISNYANTSITQTVLFTNDASRDTLKYCNITGNCLDNGYNGVIFFGTTTGPYGCDSNGIDHCDIHADTVNFPTTLIGSFGTAYRPNHSNTISNNNLYDFGSSSNTIAYGISISNNSSDFRITGNHIYETQAITAGASLTQRGIFDGTYGTISIIGNNYIGGSAAYCSGSPWTVGSSLVIFIAIATSGNNSLIQGNTIKNITVTSNSSSTNIYGIAGGGGVIDGNIIGSASGNGSISIISSSTGAAPIAYGININAGYTNDNTITNNVIGSINLSGSTTSNGASFIGIQGGTRSNTISGNTIGSLTTSNSINASTNSTVAQNILGIYVPTGTTSYTTSITNNTIANLTNASASTSSSNYVGGINVSTANAINSQDSVSGNIIQGLTSASANPGTGATAALYGISANVGMSSNNIYVGRNRVNNLVATNTSAAVNVYGLYCNVSSSLASNIISRNFIHSFSSSSTSPSSLLSGIYVDYGAGGGFVDLRNNMIRLGINPDSSSLTQKVGIYGINKQGIGDMSVVHNTVYIGGTGVVSGSPNTACFRRVTDGFDNVYNNIFYNARTNSSTGGYHYSMMLNSNTYLGCNGNVHYTGSISNCMIRLYTTDYTNFNTYRSAIGMESGSSDTLDPRLSNPTGSSLTADLHITSGALTPVEGNGISAFTLTEDFDGQTRSSLTPVDIGADAGIFVHLPVPVKWLTFEGKLEKETAVLLDWSTASEINNDHFEIERNLNSSQPTVSGWKKTGSVKGNGNSSLVNKYQFSDDISDIDPNTSRIYYRLKQVDLDGHLEYSKIISVKLNRLNEQISIVPNPSTDKIRIIVDKKYDGNIQYSLFDVSGKEIQVNFNEVTNEMDVSKLENGIYYIVVRNDHEFIKIFKVIKI